MSDTIDWETYWKSIGEGIDTSASGLLTMWTAFTDPGFRNIFIDSASITSWNGNDVTITADIKGVDNQLYTVTMFAGPEADDTGMYVMPATDSMQFNGLTPANIVNGYDFGTGTLAQDHSWLETLYGGGGGFEGSGGYDWASSWGDWGGGGGGSFGWDSGYNAYGMYEQDNIY
jgi:hypothetical protein